MAVSILGSGLATGGSTTYTASAGSSNRLLVICLAREASATGTTPDVTALSFGTPSLANGQIIQAVVAQQTALNRISAYVWYIKDANIPAGAETPTATWDITMGGTADLFTLFTLDGVNQDTPVENTHAAAPTVNADPITGTITVADNTVQILSCATQGANAATPPADWTEVRDTSDTAYRAIVQSRVTSTGGTVTWVIDNGNQTGSIAIASFNPAPASNNAPRARFISMMANA